MYMHMPIHMSMHMSMHMSIHMSIHIYIVMSIRLCICKGLLRSGIVMTGKKTYDQEPSAMANDLLPITCLFDL